MMGKGARVKNKAQLKAELAALGQTLHPDATIQYVEKPKAATSVIVLDRVVKNALPDYCCHGYASCVRCNELCWLGHETERIVASHEASALCLDCANEMKDELGPASYRVEDHKRADGPHT